AAESRAGSGWLVALRGQFDQGYPPKDRYSMEQNVIRKTYGAAHTNAIIELVADDMHEDRLKLLIWKEGQAIIGPRVRVDIESKTASETELETVTFEPEELDPTFRHAIRFPSHA